MRRNGLAREGQPWAVSRRSLRNWVHARSRKHLFDRGAARTDVTRSRIKLARPSG